MAKTVDPPRLRLLRWIKQADFACGWAARRALEALGSLVTNPASDDGFFIGLTALPIFVALDSGHGRGQKQQHENTADNLKYYHENDPGERVGTKQTRQKAGFEWICHSVKLGPPLSFHRTTAIPAWAVLENDWPALGNYSLHDALVP